MKTAPLLTIVTISRNDGEGLRRTLQSAYRLRENPLVEQIVIDGSDAEYPTPALPEGVRYERRPPKGVSDAFNAGLSASQGQWIWFLNGGDAAHPDLDVSVLLGVLRATKAGTVVFNVEVGEGKLGFRPPVSKLWPPADNWLFHQGVVMRASLLRKCGGFSTSYRIAADFNLLIRAVADGMTTDILDMPIAVFAEGGLSSQRVPMTREALEILLRHFPRLFAHSLMNLLRLPYQLLALTGIGYLGLRPRNLRRPRSTP